MNNLFFLPIIIAVILSLTLVPNNILAETEVGASYVRNDIGITPDGNLIKQITIETGTPKIFDGDNYKPYLFSNDLSELKVETMGASITLDKSSCEFNFYNKGIINDNQASLFSDDIVPYQSVSGSDTWNIINSVDNAECKTSWNGTELKATKNVNGTGSVEYVYILVNGKWKTELRVHNESGLNNRLFGFNQIINLNRDTINYGGSQKNLDDFHQVTLDRAWLENNQGKVIDFLNGYNFDFDLGFDSLASVYIEDTGVNKSRLTFGYFYNQTILPHNATMIIDPTYTEDTSDGGGYHVDTNNDGACTTYGTTSPAADIYIGMIPSASANDCYVGDIEFDLTGISQDDYVITGATLTTDFSVYNNPEDIKIVGIDFDDLSARTDTQRFDSIVAESSTYVAAWDPTATGEQSTSLGTTFETELTTALSNGDSQISLGFLGADLTQSASDESSAFDSNTGTNPPSLSFTYVELVLPNPPTTLSGEKATSTTADIWFDASDFDGYYNDASLIEDYDVYRMDQSGGFAYHLQPLPDSSGQDFNYTESITGALDFEGNELLLHFETLEPVRISGGTLFADTAASGNSHNMYSGSITRAGEKLETASSAVIGEEITKVCFNLLKSGSPTGTVTATVRDDGGDSIQLTYGTLDPSTLTGSFVEYCFENLTGYTGVENDRYLVEYSGGDASNYVRVQASSPDVWDGANSVYTLYNSGYTEYVRDVDMSFYTEETANIGLTDSGIYEDDSILSTTDGYLENGIIGKSLNLNGTYINFTSTDLDVQGTNDFIIGMLYNLTSAIGGGYQTLFSYDTTNDFEIRLGTDSIAVFRGVTQIVNVTFAHNANSLNHVIIQKNSADCYGIYGNGSLISACTTDATDLGSPTDNIYHIGADASLSNGFDGTIDEFFIGNGTLVTSLSGLYDDIFNRYDTDTFSWTYFGSTSNATSDTITGITSDTDQFIRVTSDNGAFNSTKFAVLALQMLTLNPPENVTATPVSVSQINFEWDPPDEGNTPTGYRIFCESPIGNGFTTQVSNTTTTTAYYNFTGLLSNTQQNCMIASLTDSVSSNSTAANATTFGVPSAITDLSIGSETVDTLTLTWSAPAHNGFAITGYFIEFETPVGGGFGTLIADTGTTDVTYLHESLAALTQYNYRVSAINSNGTAPVSNEANSTTVSEPPENLVTNSTSPTQIYLDWDPPTPSAGVTGYYIERENPYLGGWSDLVVDTGNTDTDYNDVTVTTGIIYNYRVSAITASGNSQVSNESQMTAFRVPEAVDDLTAVATGFSSVDLGWTEPDNLFAPLVLGYWINYTTPLGDPQVVITNNTESTSVSYESTGIPVGSPTSFRVSVVTVHGVNASGNIANATTFSEFTIGALSIENGTNANRVPVLFTRSNINDTAVLLDVNYPNTVSDFRCDFAYEYGQTNQTYSGLTSTTWGTVGSVTYLNSSFIFYDYTNEIITAYCWDNADYAINGTYLITQQTFPFVDLIADYRDGTIIGGDGNLGVIDLVTFIVIIISMIGFNKKNPAAGIIIAIMVLGGTAFFGIISFPTIITSVLALLVMVAIVITRKDH